MKFILIKFEKNLILNKNIIKSNFNNKNIYFINKINKIIYKNIFLFN